MCIAIIKPKGSELPSEEWLENSFWSNADGGGFAVLKPKSKVIAYEKGYFNLDEYLNVLHSKIRTEDTALIHMRITTHGGTSAECCHPFPITHKYNEMKQVKGITDSVLVHNGVLGGRFGAKAKQGVSDTMVLTQYIAKADLSQYDDSFSVLMQPVLSGNNKVAVLTKDGVVKAGKGWIQENDGNLYSNDTYRWGDFMYGGYGWKPLEPKKKKKKKYSKFSFNQNIPTNKGYRRRSITDLNIQEQMDLEDGICPECLSFIPDAVFGDYTCNHCKVEFY